MCDIQPSLDSASNIQTLKADVFAIARCDVLWSGDDPVVVFLQQGKACVDQRLDAIALSQLALLYRTGLVVLNSEIIRAASIERRVICGPVRQRVCHYWESFERQRVLASWHLLNCDVGNSAHIAPVVGALQANRPFVAQ